MNAEYLIEVVTPLGLTVPFAARGDTGSSL
jgi:hypothetical protein